MHFFVVFQFSSESEITMNDDTEACSVGDDVRRYLDAFSSFLFVYHVQVTFFTDISRNQS